MSEYPRSPLMGQMMSQPLLISSIIKHADRYLARTKSFHGASKGTSIVTPITTAMSAPGSWPMHWADWA
jgi:hypothetical protein